MFTLRQAKGLENCGPVEEGFPCALDIGGGEPCRLLLPTTGKGLLAEPEQGRHLAGQQPRRQMVGVDCQGHGFSPPAARRLSMALPRTSSSA